MNHVETCTGRITRLRSEVIAAVMAVVAVLTAALPASAHTSLVSSDPADGASLSAAPTAATLIFDGPIQPEFVEVVVLDAAGTRYEQGAPQVDGGTVRQQLGRLSNGMFQVSYRVVAADGHSVTGTLSFSVLVSASPPTPTEAPAAVPPVTDAPVPTAVPPPTEETTTAEVGLAAPWALVSTGVVLLLALSTGLVALRLRRARRADNGGAHLPEREHLSEER